MSKIIELISFEKALKKLGEALDDYQKTPIEYIRDSSIQRFEFCYELSHKMLKRHLENTSPNPDEIDTLSFSNLIRAGSERGLLRNGWPQWKKYRDLRCATSHTYDENKALEVMEQIPEFYDEARYLLKQLQANNEQ